MLVRLWEKVSDFDSKYTDICFQSTSKMWFLGARNGTAQMFSLTPSRNMSAGKFLKSERVLAVLREYIIFNVK